MLKDQSKKGIREYLLAQGVNATTQRVELAHYILHNFNHITADEIHRLMNQDFARVSRATIYNTLNLFVDIGLLGKLDMASGSTIYDVNTVPHHHVVDASSGELMDVHLPSAVEDSILRSMQAELPAGAKLRLEDLRIVVQGSPA